MDDNSEPKSRKESAQPKGKAPVGLARDETAVRAEQDAEMRSRLRDAAERLSQGDESVLQDLSTPRVLKPPAPRILYSHLPPVADSVGGCMQVPYLVEVIDGAPRYNHFNWWHRKRDASGPITLEFECEFNRPLVTIVGANTASLSAKGYTVLPWDGVGQNFASPNDVPGIPFAVRVDRPDSNPVFRDQNLITETDPGLTAQRVLVNEGFSGATAGGLGNRPYRPSLWIDFFAPQRAVGLEFGYVSEAAKGDREPDADAVFLYAYDRAGQRLNDLDENRQPVEVKSDARQIRPGVSRLEKDKVRRVGVLDARARIWSVELRFDEFDLQNPGIKLVEQQLVYRVWFESLPPAAVLQDTIAFGTNPDPAEKAGPVQISLPFHCNRAAVMMRGFKLEFLDQQPHEVGQVEVGLEAPAVFHVAPGGTVSFNATGALSTRPENPVAVRGRVYYTLVAWDATQVEVFAAQGTVSEHSEDEGLFSWMILPDPCPVPLSSRILGADVNELCGELFGGLQGFSFRMDEVQDLEQLYLQVGIQPVDTLMRVGLLSEQIAWAFNSSMEGDDDDGHVRASQGTILTGRSVRGLPDEPANDEERSLTENATRSIPFTFTELGPRAGPDAFQLSSSNVSAAWPVRADLAFVALKLFHCLPDGPLRELEVEVRSDFYDGSIVEWRMGAGISVSTPDDEEQEVIYGFPMFGALVRKTAFARPRLEAQPLRFEGVVGFRTASDNTGVIRNVGDAGIFLTAFARGGEPEDALFEYYVLWRGRWLSLARLVDFTPLPLRPGESLLLGGYYTPIAVAGDPVAGIPRNMGFLLVTTSNPDLPTIIFQAHGFARAANPDCQWQPDVLDFGDVPIGASKALMSALVSIGETQVIIDGFRLGDPNAGFGFSLPPQGQIEPGIFVMLFMFTPGLGAAPGLVVEASFFADTNAGTKTLTLRARPINGN